MINEPKRLPDGNQMQRWLQSVVSWARQFRIVESSDIKPSIGPDGTLLTIKKRAGPGGGSADQWRGEWRVGEEYSSGDMVIRGSNNEASAAWNDAETILRTGVQAGLYRARGFVPADADPPAEPDDSGYWETMARFATPVFSVKKVGLDNQITLDSSSAAQASIIMRGPATGQTINLVCNGSGTVDIVTADLAGRRAHFQRVCVKVGGVNKAAMVLMTDPE